MTTPSVLAKNRQRWLLYYSIGLLAFLLGGCGEVALYSNIHEKHANEMMAILLSRGIDCTKVQGVDEFWSVMVEKKRMAEAVDLLKTYGYPKDNFQTVGEVFKKSGLVSSPSEERIRFMHALSQELSETLSRIDGVLTSRVHIVLQNNDPLAEVMTPASASVFIKHRRGTNVPNLAAQIKKLVTNSIEGLVYDKVTVAFFMAQDNEIDRLSLQQQAAGGNRVYLYIGVGLLMLVLLGAAGGGYFYYMKKTPPVADSEE